MYHLCMSIFFFKQKTAYEMRISDWSSDVCSSDLAEKLAAHGHQRPAGKVQIHEIALVANGGELAVQRVAPAMIAADEAPCFAGQFGDQRCAAKIGRAHV